MSVSVRVRLPMPFVCFSIYSAGFLVCDACRCLHLVFALCLKEESDIPTSMTEELQSILDVTSAFMDLINFVPQGSAMQTTLDQIRVCSQSPTNQEIVNEVLHLSLL